MDCFLLFDFNRQFFSASNDSEKDNGSGNSWERYETDTAICIFPYCIGSHRRTNQHNTNQAICGYAE